MRKLTDIIRLCAIILGMGLAAGAPAKAQDSASGDPALRTSLALTLPDSVNPDDVHLLRTVWNGTPVVFADYHVRKTAEGRIVSDADSTADDEDDVILTAFVRADDGYHVIHVDTLEDEGGPADIAAIAFANADKDKARELILLVTWPQVHYAVYGAFYEVHVFDDLDAGAKPLTAISKHFGLGCECSFDDGREETYRFKTVTAIRGELSRMGY